MIRFACPQCQKGFAVEDKFAGRTTKCPNCGTAILIPGTPAPPPSGSANTLPPGVNDDCGLPSPLSQPSPVDRGDHALNVASRKTSPGPSRMYVRKSPSRAGPLIAFLSIVGVLLVGVSLGVMLWANGTFSGLQGERPHKNTAYHNPPPSGRSALNVLKKVQARIEVGINYADYSTVVGEGWGEVKVFAESPEGKTVPDFSDMLVSAMAKYKLALDVWRSVIDAHEFIPARAFREVMRQECWQAAGRRLKVAESLISGDDVTAGLSRAAILRKSDKTYEITMRSLDSTVAGWPSEKFRLTSIDDDIQDEEYKEKQEKEEQKHEKERQEYEKEKDTAKKFLDDIQDEEYEKKKQEHEKKKQEYKKEKQEYEKEKQAAKNFQAIVARKLQAIIDQDSREP